MRIDQRAEQHETLAVRALVADHAEQRPRHTAVGVAEHAVEIAVVFLAAAEQAFADVIARQRVVVAAVDHLQGLHAFMCAQLPGKGRRQDRRELIVGRLRGLRRAAHQQHQAKPSQAHDRRLLIRVRNTEELNSRRYNTATTSEEVAMKIHGLINQASTPSAK